MEIDKENPEKTMILAADLEAKNHSGTRTSTTSQKHDFPFCKVPTQVPVVDVLSLPAKYFKQFPRKDAPAKNRAPIEEGVKAEDILEWMLEGKMKVTPKELWAIALKLWMALKKILTSKRTASKSLEPDLETNENRPQKNLVSVNSLGSPEIRQKSLETDDRRTVEIWTGANLVLQFLESKELNEREQ